MKAAIRERLASAAATTRYEKRESLNDALTIDYHTCKLETLREHVAVRRKELTEAVKVLEERSQPSATEKVKCAQCKKAITGRPMAILARKIEGTEMFTNDFICDATCYARFAQKK